MHGAWSAALLPTQRVGDLAIKLSSRLSRVSHTLFRGFRGGHDGVLRKQPEVSVVIGDVDVARASQRALARDARNAQDRAATYERLTAVGRYERRVRGDGHAVIDLELQSPGLRRHGVRSLLRPRGWLEVFASQPTSLAYHVEAARQDAEVLLAEMTLQSPQRVACHRDVARAAQHTRSVTVRRCPSA